VLVVGEGRREPGWVAEVLSGRVRRPDVPVVAAHGLTLEEVRYPPDEELAARAQSTRRRREQTG
jgi:tRNA pseudouridine38-40 synthase